MKVQGSVLVADILAALDINLPEGCTFSESDSIDLDDVEVDNDLAAEELPESYFPEYELTEHVEEHDVKELAAALRRGDIAEAEYLLDKIFGNDRIVTEWVQLGRYSQRAKPIAKSEPLRSVA